MFQPSGKGSTWIQTTRVQATCNLESIVITAMQMPFKGHHLRHYDIHDFILSRVYRVAKQQSHCSEAARPKED